MPYPFQPKKDLAMQALQTPVSKLMERAHHLRAQSEHERLERLREELRPHLTRAGNESLVLHLLEAKLRGGKLADVLAMHHDPRLQKHAEVCWILQDHDPDFLEQLDTEEQLALHERQRPT